MTTKVRDIDKGWRKHKKQMQRHAKMRPHVKVGILGPDAEKAHQDSKLTVIEVASFHEFGYGNNPERSFIRASFDANSRKYVALMRKLAQQVLAGNLTEKQALGAFGEKVVADVKNYMKAGIPPDLSAGGISRLKDTGQLYGSVVAEVNA